MAALRGRSAVAANGRVQLQPRPSRDASAERGPTDRSTRYSSIEDYASAPGYAHDPRGAVLFAAGFVSFVSVRELDSKPRLVRSPRDCSEVPDLDPSRAGGADGDDGDEP